MNTLLNRLFRIQKVDIRNHLWRDIFMLAVLLGVIVTARTLTPKGSGMGTHTELGFPPCTFYVLTKYPCPGCGLTTSFTHITRFHFREALKVHPFGPILFALVLMMLLHLCIKLCSGYSITPNMTVRMESLIVLLLFLGFMAFFALRCMYFYSKIH